MRSPLKIALLAAVPVELANFCLLSAKIGDPMPKQFFGRLIAEQWLALHWLGVLSLNALYRLGSTAVWEIGAFLLCGYVETALLLVLVLYAARGLKHRHEGNHYRGSHYRENQGRGRQAIHS